jgi:hypothetical protein
MAFSPNRVRAARRLRVGDQLLFYSTRGAFNNPRFDRGRVFGVANVAGDVEDFPERIRIARRWFTAGCDLKLVGLTPMRTGLELAPLISRLEVFPSAGTKWAAKLRQPLVELPETDAALISQELQPLLRTPERVLGQYAAPTPE